MVKICPKPRKARKERHGGMSPEEADNEGNDSHKTEPGLSQPPDEVGRVGSKEAGTQHELTDSIKGETSKSHWSLDSDNFTTEETQPYPVPSTDYWSSEETEELLGTSTMESIEQRQFPHFQHFTDTPEERPAVRDTVAEHFLGFRII